MEINRDNQKDNRLTSIPYNPDLFHNDRDFYLAYKKIEHIAAAIFLVTGLIERDVLLRERIREHSLNCVSRIVSLIGKPNLDVADLQSVASNVMHLSSLLDIAFWSGQVSQMNLSILQQEITRAYQTLNDLSTKYRNTFYIGSSFFKTDAEILAETGEVKDSPKRPTPMQNFVRENPQPKRQEPRTDVRPEFRPEPKPQMQQQTVSEMPSMSQTAHVSSSEPAQTIPTENKGQRREAILSLLRERTNLTVKDFTTVVPQYSEKTIQRELLALVDEGIIVKQGERRWSTYSLAS